MKTRKQISKITLVFLILISFSLAGDIIEILRYDYFKEEVKQSEIKPKPIVWKLSKIDGIFVPKKHLKRKYKLVEYHLYSMVKPNIFSLELLFKKGKTKSKNLKREFYYIWFDGNQIIFLVNKKKYKYDIGKFYKRSLSKGLRNNKVEKNKNSVMFNIRLPAYRGRVFLSLYFDKIMNTK